MWTWMSAVNYGHVQKCADITARSRCWSSMRHFETAVQHECKLHPGSDLSTLEYWVSSRLHCGVYFLDTVAELLFLLTQPSKGKFNCGTSSNFRKTHWQLNRLPSTEIRKGAPPQIYPYHHQRSIDTRTALKSFSPNCPGYDSRTKPEPGFEVRLKIITPHTAFDKNFYNTRRKESVRPCPMKNVTPGGSPSRIAGSGSK